MRKPPTTVAEVINALAELEQEEHRIANKYEDYGLKHWAGISRGSAFGMKLARELLDDLITEHRPGGV